METKTCTRCGSEKTVSQFHRQHNSRDGYCHVCRDCCRRGKTPGSQKHKYGRKVEYVSLVCPTCGVTFEKSPGFMKCHPGHKFCSKKCNGIAFRKADTDAEKLCTKCGNVKPLSAFTGIVGREDRVSAHCNDCKTRYAQRIAKTEPERFAGWRKKATRNYLDNHPDRWASDSVLRHQIKRGLPKEIQIPNDLISMKRAQIQIHRATKQLLQTTKEKQNAK